MGKTYLFECGLCHYRVKVSGGSDAGVDCHTQTLLCHDCRELFDVFTRVRRQSSPVGKFQALHPEIPPAALAGSPARKKSWEAAGLTCPMEHDRIKHRVEAWKDPGRCPRCGSFMEKNGVAFRVWD
jgi:hypothetical protein